MSINSKHGVTDTADVPPIDIPEFSNVSKTMRFGGLDLAKRVDHSALQILQIKEGTDCLEDYAYQIWPHVNYNTVAKNMLKIQQAHPMNLVGYDRTGVGDAVIELFDAITIPFTPIMMSRTKKIQAIYAVQMMLQTGQLKLDKKSPIREQIETQQLTKTPAGNITYNHPSGTHDDLFWGLAYAVLASIEYITQGHEWIIKQGYKSNHNMSSEDRAMNDKGFNDIFSSGNNTMSDSNVKYNYKSHRW